MPKVLILLFLIRQHKNGSAQLPQHRLVIAAIATAATLAF